MVIQTGQPFLFTVNYGNKTYYDLPQKYFTFNITLHQFLRLSIMKAAE